jgi:hypothetical protein
MMLMRARRCSRLVAAVLLLASARLPHLAADDVACVPAALAAYGQHDETDHGLRPAGQEPQEHCGLCHFTRSLRSPGTALAEWDARINPPSLVHQGPPGAPLASLPDSLPARAPPASLR